MTDSKHIDDGGLAFPGTRYQQVGTVADHGFSDDASPTFDEVHHPGMTLRDWFAGQALPALLAELYTASRIAQKGYEESVFDAASSASFEIADAMLDARKGGAA